MSGSHHSAGPIAEQHRQTVSSHHDAGLIRLMGAGSIGIRRTAIVAADGMNHGAVHLIEPVEGPRDGGRLLQASAIGLDSHRFIPHVGAQIETGKDPFANTTIPGG